MPAHEKAGLQYWNIYCLDTKEIQMLISKYAMEGYGTYVRLCNEIFKHNGYYMDATEDYLYLFCKDNKIEFDKFLSILDFCFRQNLFNKKIFVNHNVITGFFNQSEWLFISKKMKRKNPIICKDFIIPEKTDNFQEITPINSGMNNTDFLRIILENKDIFQAVLEKYELLPENYDLIREFIINFQEKNTQKKRKERKENIFEEEYSFINFKKLYETGRSFEGKDKFIEEKYNQISDDDKILIFAHIPTYFAAQTSPRFIKSAENYLIGKIWQTEYKKTDQPQHAENNNSAIQQELKTHQKNEIIR